MNEPRVEQHVEAFRANLRTRAWHAPRVEAAWRELARQREVRLARFRRVASFGAGALALALAFALAFVGLRTFGQSPAPLAVPASVAEPRLERVELGLGTEAQLEPNATLDVRERTDVRVVVAVQAGTARFRVRHDPRRLFRVEVGDVAVEDLGTEFIVENKGSSVRIAVSEGSVAVTLLEAGKPRRVTLNAGESGIYPTKGSASDATAVAEPAPAASAEESEQRGAGVVEMQPATSWRELARAGKHRPAYDLLAPSGFRDVRDDAGDLLLASDVARLSRHPTESVVLLRKLLARHSSDPRAPSAAFTLGWLLMNELGRPREAAAAFAKAEALAPRGNLAEDAVARSVEAWHRAGDETRARAEVERYRRAYPQGRHQAMLQRLVGMP
jgi:transmembrane sensor